MEKPESSFLSARYWPQLDGLRTVSIAMVLVSHMSDPHIWGFLNGSLGVTLFFVISGFLITSLLTREERRRGRVSIIRFYVRRAFRILPLYYLALSTAAIAVFVLGLGEGPEKFAERLPLLATFNGDLAGGGSFVHSWSLGIEEKFYVVWPFLMFAIPLMKRHRLAAATVLLGLASAAGYIEGARYFGTYTAILAGCVLGLIMHTPRGFRVVSKLAQPRVAALLIPVAITAYILDPILPGGYQSGHAHVVFSYTVALLFPSVILAASPLTKLLSWKPVAFLGTRTYAIYLFHPFCIDVVSMAIPAGQQNFALAIVRLVLAAVLSVAVAEVMARAIEQPLIRMGKRLTSSPGPTTTRSPAPVSES
ncbi:acyltransferase [Paenarthrobacter aurescens]|uniref:Acyltransferase n=1 Tax=Paenarthrobacter aurescens TaxID=43663 RepID=A0A4Y3NFK3_PAEAU|nr:acyltransferase [Paenarthrobacter aurescens]MDO6145596.1 acyltransferase [Paenarthrobacter aurescens]MDO6149405.1 acyltransferase [Paenarthrobacter aurescens]MDO6160645.1 acyltransferase [Paenarthrobacter aurescens]GEB20043.1 acyltransferase [Paenarthrobacter aurescens]